MAATMSTSTPTYASMVIRFIETVGRPSTDDWIRVVPIHNSNATVFVQEYQIMSRLDGNRIAAKVMGGANLLEYIETILRLVSADDLPCKQLQFDIPNVPTILVNHNHIRNRIPEVVDMLRQIVEFWPQVGTELPSSSVFTNINWNATAQPFVPSSRPTPLTIPAPPFNWNSTTFRTPSSRSNRRHMFFDDNGNEIVDLTMDSDSE